MPSCQRRPYPRCRGVLVRFAWLGLAAVGPALGCGPRVTLPGVSAETDTGGEAPGEARASDSGAASTSSTTGGAEPSTSGGPSSTSSGGSPPPTTSGASETTAGSTGPQIECEAFISDPSPENTYWLEIHNDSEIPIYVQPFSCSWRAPFVLRELDGEPLAYALDECGPFECEDLMFGSECSQACPDCAQPPPVRLDPGGVWADAWSGLVYEPSQLPPECTNVAGCEGPCPVARQPPAGAYGVELQLFTTCEGDCICEGDLDDSACYLTSGAIADPVQALGIFSYPDDLHIQLSYAGDP